MTTENANLAALDEQLAAYQKLRKFFVKYPDLPIFHAVAVDQITCFPSALELDQIGTTLGKDDWVQFIDSSHINWRRTIDDIQITLYNIAPKPEPQPVKRSDWPLLLK